MDRKRKEFEEERREVKAQEMKAEETHFELMQIKDKVMHQKADYEAKYERLAKERQDLDY